MYSTANHLGPGKAIEPGANGTIVLEYFDHPGQPAEDRVREAVARTSLRRFELVPETRVFWEVPNEVPSWRSGRVFSVAPDEQVEVSGYGSDHGFHDPADLYVRWDQPLRDPAGLARVGLFESPYNVALRAPVLTSVLDQRAATHGMPGLLSVSAELHAHQVSAARRVLEDHVQRYLLADEVGLGKTIEALLVLRQLMLDEAFLSATVIVPRHLAGQWQHEIDTKLHPEHFPGSVVEVVTHDETQRWVEADIVVVDEAHQLVGTGGGDRRFERLREVASASPRLLLVSATPALQNERAFLGMLHLLDPDVYSLDDVQGLQRRLESRQGLGRAMLGLSPDAPEFLLSGTLGRLRDQLAGQDELLELVDAVAAASSAERPGAVRELRQQIADTFQVHRRMIRTRRTEQLARTFPLTGRGGCRVLDGLDDAWGESVDELERIREDLAISVERGDFEPREAASALAAVASRFPDGKAMGEAAEKSPAAGQVRTDLPSLAAQIADALTYEVRGNESAVVFAPTQRVVEALANGLSDLLGPGAVVTLTTDLAAEDSRARLESHEHRRVQWLICDRSAEEGTNLQHADVLVHVGLPGAVNELEQRIGRLDRWTARRSAPWRAVEVSPLSGTMARWSAIVREGFGVHSRSLAALQRAVEEWSLKSWERLLDPNSDLEGLNSEVRGALDSETEAVREHDAIDAVVLGDADRRFSDRLLAADDVADESFPHDFQNLLTDANGNLRLRRQGNPAENLGIYEADDPRTRKGQAPLIPLGRFGRDIAPALKHSWAGTREVAVERGAGLLRLGSPLVDAIADFLRHDDRGRAWGLWRYDRNHQTAPEIWVRVDLHLHADPEPVADKHGLDAAVLQRRLDGVFPPRLARVWWSPGQQDAPSEALRRELERPYSKPDSHDPDAGDFHLSRTRIGGLLPLLDRPLAQLVDQAVDFARTGVTARPEVVVAMDTAAKNLNAASASRRASLERRRRAQPLDATGLLSELELERALLPALLEQIRHPTVAIDTLGVIVLSGENPFVVDDDE